MFSIIVNQPGCLPEQDPYTVDTIEDARQALIEEIMRTANGDLCAPASAACEEVLEISSHGGEITLSGYVHSIEPV